MKNTIQLLYIVITILFIGCSDSNINFSIEKDNFSISGNLFDDLGVLYYKGKPYTGSLKDFYYTLPTGNTHGGKPDNSEVTFSFSDVTFKNGKFNGYIEINSNNYMGSSKGNYVEGKRIGEFISFHNNGEISSISYFKEPDVPEGIHMTFYEDGILSTFYNYKNGLLDSIGENYGRSIIGIEKDTTYQGYREFYDNDSMIKLEEFDVNKKYLIDKKIKLLSTKNIK